jgi:ADP-ribosylglycohydrolase
MFGNLLFSNTNQEIKVTDEVMSVLFGLAVGDALGVPVEFKSRETIRRNPVKGMVGFGTYNVPPGTWSDDSSLAFCLAETLTTGFDLNSISQNFQKWFYQSYWTPYGKVFDFGATTRQAIENLSAGTRPDLAGGFGENENGNGSLMRILPLLFYIKDKPIEERYKLIKAVSSITHGHVRSVISCFYYMEFARGLLNRENKFYIYNNLKTGVSDFLNTLSIAPSEIGLFGRLLNNDIHDLPEDQIQSSGYVLHTLEASIWCLLTTDTYKDAVLKAVNLGEDTDTTGAVTGGLAGLLYGFNNIPETWIKQLARREDIEDLAKRLITQIMNG